MGISESHIVEDKDSEDVAKIIKQRGFHRRYSSPPHLTHLTISKKSKGRGMLGNFYAPPILHTRCLSVIDRVDALGLDAKIVKENGVKHGTDLSRKESNSSCLSGPNRHFETQTSVGSVTSSGVESIHDYPLNAPAVRFESNEHSQAMHYTHMKPKSNKMKRYKQQNSFDSGADVDDSVVSNGKHNAEEKRRRFSCNRNLSASYDKKHKKYSLKNLRERAFSLMHVVPPQPTFSTGTDTDFNKGDSAQQFFGKDNLNRQWEIVSVREMCRRLSIDSYEEKLLPLPDGSQASHILDESMIRQIVDILPARAEAYPWVLIYSSERHGFSLSTLYRKMIDWTDVLSPVLLIISDCSDNVFGAIASSALRPSEHFFGTGDSSSLFKFKQHPDSNERTIVCYHWTGKNHYFVKASKDSLLMGSSSGHYGLWLDSDLNFGRSQRCDTFNNEPLAGDDYDFTVHSIEAFGFSIL